MTQIEKLTKDGDKQYFEKYTKKDVAWSLKCAFDSLVDGEFTDEDSSIHWYLKDGSYGCMMSGFPVSPKPAIAKIDRFYEDNGGATIGFFGKEIKIVQREEYGDWEINF